MEETRGVLSSLRRFPILYGITWAMFVAVIATLLVSFFVHYSGFQETQVRIAAYSIHCIAVLIGAVSASRCAAERGWYYGGITGLLYALIMVMIGLLVYNTFDFNPGGIFRIFLMAVIGAFSGILGVNSVRDR